MNYTKGKWMVRIDNIGIDVIEQKSGFGIVDIGSEKSLSDCEYPIEEAKANAKLIAAAPEMYEALEFIANKLDEEEMNIKSKEFLLWETAEKALKKAKGE